MPGPSPFASEWRDCLMAHYQNVLRNQDTLTEGTLLGVLQEVGFSEQELVHFKVQATMRADDMGPDFVPDMDALQAVASVAVEQPAASLPEEPGPEPPVFAAAVFEAAVTIEEDSGSVMVIADEAAPDEDGISALPADEEPPDYRATGPEQLSMF